MRVFAPYLNANLAGAGIEFALLPVQDLWAAEGHCHGACPDNRPERDDPLGTVGGDESDAIATGDPSPREASGKASGNVAKLGERLGFFAFAGKSDDSGIPAARTELSP